MSDVVTVEIDGTTAVVTLDRPEARNALNSEVLREAPAAIERLDADDAIEAIILTGADPAFCAGLDLKELGSTGANLGSSGADGRGPRRGPFAPRTTPLIGAVNGPAVTGGLEYALACDFLIASERARFADTHARVGVMPGWGLTVLLPQAIGVRRARQMSVTGNYVDATTALAWGLVNEVVPHDGLLDRCRQLATDVASNDRRGVAQMLRTYEATTGVGVDEGWSIEARMAAEWAPSISTDEVERRRAAIQERGRTQTSG
ncbi:MAG: enoyl-CoA hydratase [Actinomycetota bacterium]